MNYPVNNTKMRLLPILALLFLSACGVGDILLPPTASEEPIEIITIGPYIQRCYGAHGERDCLMEYNAESGQWEFFYEWIQGFDFEPGFIYTLEVRLEDRGPDIQDVGQYAYHLVKVIEKTKAPDDFSYDW